MTKQEIKQAWEKFLANKGVDVGIVIRCDTEKKAKKLLKYLHKKGFAWSGGTSLTKITKWSDYKNETCYTSEITFYRKEYFLNNNFKILSFDDIEKYIDKKKKVDIKEYFELKKEVTRSCYIGCIRCPLHRTNNGENIYCDELEQLNPHKTYKLLKKAKMEKERKDEN